MKTSHLLLAATLVLRFATASFAQTILWNGNGDGFSWSSAQNWAGGQVPGPANTVVITNGNGSNVVISSAVSIQSVRSTRPLVISAGSLTVTTGASSLSAALTIGAATLEASGSGTSLTASGPVTATNASLLASGGASLSLPGLAFCDDSSGGSILWQASGTNSQLALNGLTNILGPYSYYSGNALAIQAVGGGQIQLPALTAFDNVGQVEAGGDGSMVSLPVLQSFNGATEGGAVSILQTSAGGTITLGQLANLTDVTITLGSGTISLASVTNLSSSTLTVTNGSVILPNLVNIDNANLEVSDGAGLSLPAVRSVNGPSGGSSLWQANGTNSLLALNGLTNIVGLYSYYSDNAVVIQAVNGGQIQLPALAALGNVVQVEAEGGGSEVSLPALQSFNGATESGAGSILQTSTGGTIALGQLANLTDVTITLGSGTISLASVTNLSSSTLTVTNGSVVLPNVVKIDNANLQVAGGAALSLPAVRSVNGPSGGSSLWQANGTNSLLALNGLTNIVGLYSYYSDNAVVIQAVNGGQIQLPALAALGNVVQVEAEGGGSEVSLPALQSFNGATEGGAGSILQTSTGGTIALGQLANLTDVTITLGSGTISLASVTNLSSSTLTVTNGSVILPNVVNIDNANLEVSDGAGLSLPAVLSVNDAGGGYSLWQASGTNSLLALDGLTNIVGPYSYYSGNALLIQALGGGQIQLNALAALGNVVQVEAGGAGSKVSLPVLQSFNGATEGGALSMLQTSAGGTIALGQLASLADTTITLGSGMISLDSVTNLSAATLSVTNGSVVLPNVVNIDNANLEVTGGASLSLPAVQSVNNAGGGSSLWQASGTNSLLALDGLTNIAGPYSYYSGNALVIQAVGGGQVQLEALGGFGGVVQVEAEGGGSAISLPFLQSFAGATENSAGSVLQTSAGGTITLGQLANLEDVTITLGNGTVNLSSLTNLSATTLSVTNGAVVLPNVVNIDNANLEIAGGASLSLPAVRSVNNANGGSSLWQTSGTNSLLALDGLTNIVGPYSYYSGNAQIVQAVGGGQIQLPALAALSGVMQVEAEGGGSEVSLPLLQSFDGATEDSAVAELQTSAEGAIALGRLANLTDVTITLGGGTLNLTTVTNLSGVSLTVTNGAFTLPDVVNVDGADLYALDGGSLSLPAVLQCDESAAQYPVWEAAGTNSILSLNGLTNVVAPYDAYANFNLQIEALNGGQVQLPALRSISNGYAQVIANGGGSEVALQALNSYQPSRTTFTSTNSGAVLLPQYADLEPIDLAAPAQSILGQPISFTYTTTNLSGTPATPPWLNQFWVSTNAAGSNALSLGTVPFTIAVPSNGAVAATQQLLLPPGLLGPVYLGVTVASGGTLPESSLSNNTAFSLTASDITAVDLAVRRVSAPSSAQFGQTVNVSFSVTNLGTAATTAAWSDQIYLSSSPVLNAGATLLATTPGGSPLAPGAGYTHNLAVALPLANGSAAGSYYLIAVADAANAQPEVSSTNNLLSALISLSLPPLPDLAVAELTAPASATAGSTVSINWIVTNQGALNITNAAWSEAVGISNGGFSAILADFRFTNSLNAGASLGRVETVTLPANIPRAEVSFFVTVNYADEIVESSLANNSTFATNATLVPAALALNLPVATVNENTSAPGLTGVVSRSGDSSAAATVSLSSSGPTHLTVPASVTIPAGAGSATFTATVLDDGIVDANAEVVLTAQATGYLSATTQVLVVNTDQPRLSLSFSPPGLSQGETTVATVTADFVSNAPVTLSVASSAPSMLAVPATVTIPAGSNSVSFTVSAAASTVLAPAQSYTVTVSAANYLSVSANLTVLNVNTPTIALSLDRTNISAGDGPLAVIGVVSRQPVTDQPLTIALTSTNALAAAVPAQVVIPAAQASAGFYISAESNPKSAGSNVTVVAAQALDLAGNAVGSPAAEMLTVQSTSGPALALAITPKVVGKGLSPAATGTVSVTSPTANALTVALTLDNPNEASIPESVTIPQGSSNAVFSIDSLQDGNPNTSTAVSITASASNHTSSSAVFAVTDLGLPDLVVQNVAAPAAVFVGEPFSVTFILANQGLGALTNAVTENVYLTTNPLSGNNLLVQTVTFPGPLAPGQQAALSVQVPASALPAPGSYWVLVVANAGGTAAESNPYNDSGIAPAPIALDIDYSATVQAGVQTVPAGTAVPLFGSATLNGSGGPAAGVQVDLTVTVHGLPRTLDVVTDANGNFSTLFTPLATEAGSYTVQAGPPGMTNEAVQARFDILGITANPAALGVGVFAGSNATVTVTLQNQSDIPLTNLAATVTGAASNLAVTTTLAANYVEAQGSVALECTVSATDASIAGSAFTIQVTSGEGATAAVPVSVAVAPAAAQLQTSPVQLTGSMLSGGQTVLQFYIVNTGGAASGPLMLALPAVSWMTVATPMPLASLAPGQSNAITLVLTPGTNLALGPYSGQIGLNGNGLATQVPFSFNNTSDTNGVLSIQSVDELTFFAAGAPPLTNAAVTLTDPFTQAIVAMGNTGGSGQFTTPPLPSGSYQLNVTAPQHAPFQGTAVVTAGQTNTIQAFLSLQTVSYSWSVVPTQIQAQAQITINATYVANVPAPVVVPNPTSLDLSSLTQAGQFMDVPFTLANYGLIAVENVAISANGGPYYNIAVVTTNLGTLAAESTLTVPMRITFLGTNQTAIRRQDAGGCIALGVAWSYPCGGHQVGSSVPIAVFNAASSCGGGGGPIEVYVTGGGGSGAVYGAVIPPSVTAPTDCDPCVTARLGAIVKCAIGFLPIPSIPLPKIVKCGQDGYKCGTGVNKDCFGTNASQAKCTLDILNCLKSGIGCSGQLGSAFLKNAPYIGWGLKAGGCAIDICMACDGLGYKGTCGSKAPAKLAKADAASFTEADAIFAPIFSAAIALQAEIAPDLYFFSDTNWVSVTDTNAEANLLNQFDTYSQSNSEAGYFISAAEQNSLLAMPIPSPLGPGDVLALIDRWNNTVSNYNVGIYTLGQAPLGADTNFIDFTNFVALEGNAASAEQTYIDEGFQDAGDALVSARTTLLNEYQQGHTGVCAAVVLQIDQTAVLTLDAFHATLQLNNNGADALTNITVNLSIQNEAGQDVTSLFGVSAPVLSGSLTGVSGSGSLGAGSTGSAQWTLAPGESAAPQAPTNYLVSGYLSYVQNGLTVTIPLTASTINVQPNPQIHLKYFLQRDVYGDDPYTPQIEPSIPFPLGVLALNQGYGTAYDFQITSAQPQIIDNQKGLLIGFDIIGAQVGAQPVAPSLTVDFGDILPMQTALGVWYLTCSLDGQFVGYTASYQNLTSVGNVQLSVIDGVETHLMTHMVRAQGAWDDGLPDFLVNDIPNVGNLPDTLYLSGGQIQPVSVVSSASVSGLVTAASLQTQVTANFPAGFSYLSLPDPAAGQFPLQAVLYGNGTNFLTNNFWITDRTFVGIGLRPVLQTNLQLFAYHTNAGPDTLTLVYGPAVTMTNTNAPVSSVFALPPQSPPQFGVVWNGASYAGAAPLAYYDIYSSDNGGSFTLWQSQTTNTSALFNGTLHHTYAFYSLATDTAGHREAIPFQPQAQTTVVSNAPPTIYVLPNTVINAGQTLSLNVTASDPNPFHTLTFSVGPGAPAGVTVNPATGQISWPTSPAFGGTTNKITVIASDNGQTGLSASATVVVVVTASLSPPVLAPLTNYTINEGQLLTFTNAATDNSVPPKPLTYSLGPGAPTNAMIDPVSGVFQWRPTAAQAPSTNVMAIVVSDNSTPPLTATQYFTVVVNPVTFELVLSVGSTNLLTGQTNRIPLILTTPLALTNLSAVLRLSTPGLTNLALLPVSDETAQTLLQTLSSNEYAITVGLNPSFGSTNAVILAELSFEAVPQVHSSIVYLSVPQISGLQSDGQPAAKPGAVNGRVIVVGAEPVLEGLLGADGSRSLAVYGNVNSVYEVAYGTNLPPTNWIPAWQAAQSNQVEIIPAIPSLPQIYLRALETNALPGSAAPPR